MARKFLVNVYALSGQNMQSAVQRCGHVSRLFAGSTIGKPQSMLLDAGYACRVTINCLGPDVQSCMEGVAWKLDTISDKFPDGVMIEEAMAMANASRVIHGKCPFEYELEGKRYHCVLREGHHRTGHELELLKPQRARAMQPVEEEQRRHPGARVVVSKAIAEKERRSLLMDEALEQASEFIVMDPSGMNVPKSPGAQIRALPKNAHWSEEKDGPVLVVELRTLDTRAWTPVFEGTVSEVKAFIDSDELRRAARAAMQNASRLPGWTKERERAFIAATGLKPENDDLERMFCKKAGQSGHQMCGMCKHGYPKFMVCPQCHPEAWK